MFTKRNANNTLPINRLSISAAIFALILTSIVALMPANRVIAACASLPTTNGSATQSVTIPANGTYRIWSRIMAPDSTNNSYYLEIDDTTCGVVVGDSTSIPANTWTWVDYQQGITTNKINATLTAGNHTIRMVGREPGVKLDRVIVVANPDCVPVNLGENCTTTPSPVRPVGDLDGDGHVTGHDLSLLLLNMNTTNPTYDLDGTDPITGHDLSLLLANYGK